MKDRSNFRRQFSTTVLFYLASKKTTKSLRKNLICGISRHMNFQNLRCKTNVYKKIEQKYFSSIQLAKPLLVDYNNNWSLIPYDAASIF